MLADTDGVNLRFDFKADGWPVTALQFRSPINIIRADSIDRVIPALTAVNTAAESGLWAAGFVAYEAAPAFDAAMEVHDENGLPLVWFGIFDKPKEYGNESSGEKDEDFIRRSHDSESESRDSAWSASISQSEYDLCINQIRASAGRGDLYQANYTFPMYAEIETDPYRLYADLAHRSQSKYAALLEIGSSVILSLSPELFFAFYSTEGTLITRPMKGTRARGRWAEEDESEAASLRSSIKDRAENLMIVDLLRNDVGRLAVPGSVSTTDLFAVERYPTLWQMTSTVKAKTKPNVRLPDIFAAMFPCGSITGAPKIAAMRKLKELERTPRGVYCGAIGIVRPGGDSLFNVAIRTMTLDCKRRTANYSVGGGITWDSSAENEYEEALSKARVLTDVHREFDLLETMRLEDGEYHLRERHLDRLAASARFFGFALDRNAIERELSKCLVLHAAGRWRVRLLVDESGSTRTECEPLEPIKSVQKYALADSPISSKDRFLYHKTTFRAAYKAAQTDNAATDKGRLFDTLQYNEKGELTEFTRGSLVVEIDGALYTPPISSGLLPGTQRAELMERGEISERIVTLNELKLASRIWFINSVRAWIEMTA